MNCLIIGYGSIGKRHAKILSQMDCHVSFVSRQSNISRLGYATIKDALRASDYDYVIIANESSAHEATLKGLANSGYDGRVLVEKPLFNNVSAIPTNHFSSAFVGYNLRFHPIIQVIKSEIGDKHIYTVNVYAGQYLPDWRPNRDYRQCYSAHRRKGGGVLRDLSHELDYVNWLFGGWKKVAATGGKFSDLQIDSDDVFSLLLETKNCPVASVHINYLDRTPRREIIVNLKDTSIKADLILNTLEINGKAKRYKIETNQTYLFQHKAVLNGDPGPACTFEQGIDVLNLIRAAELASKEKQWVNKSDLEQKA